MRAALTPFYDPTSGTVAWVVADPATGRAALIDGVLGWVDGRIDPTPAIALADFVQANGLTVDWVLETHIHADHVAGGRWLSQAVGGQLGIGEGVVEVQRALAARAVKKTGGSATGFDVLFADGQRLTLGSLEIEVLAVPGHTAGCVAYRVGDDLLVGDTLFMPDAGTARCDFPTGCAHRMWHSVRRLLELAPLTRLHHCHDYGQNDVRPPSFSSTATEQRAHNIHVRDGIDENAYVTMRQARDAHLAPPALLDAAIRANLYGGVTE
ncbi:MBL fold metallo-hydrolase [Roseiterribacter gracilis]|uniref:MBL fold metallo-hydrolase n=1 Tax=Roseiterribacter gracilis TaxID=2812848 RepID=A0A8S8X9R8_9PROT|nr:MBL fold metallo-hydrolase [Rhodospirillales bacterium TMPK1]